MNTDSLRHGIMSRLTAGFVNHFFSDQLAGIATMKGIHFDKRNHVIRVVAKLNGEDDDLRIELASCSADVDGVTFGRAESSREWVTAALERMSGKKIPVPHTAARWLKMVL